MTTSNATVDVTVLAGGRARVTATFTPLDSTTPGDPASVVFKVLAPGATEPTTYTYGADAALVRSSAGVYYLNVTASTKGDWYVKVHGSGATGINAVAEVVIQAKGTVIA